MSFCAVAASRLCVEISLRMPAPPGLAALAPARARLAARIADRNHDKIARARCRYVAERDTAELTGLADGLMAELRAALPDAPGAPWLHALAALDARLPTTADEHMDDPAFDETRRLRLVNALDRHSRFFGSYDRFFTVLAPLLAGGPSTVLDLASGHGGFAIALAHAFPRHRVISSDVRPEYVEIARRAACAAGAPVEHRVLDAFRLDESLAPGEIDVITCTQSLHHFGAGGACLLAAEALRHARRGICFIDLARSASLLAALAAVAAVSERDPAFLHDATVSVRKAFVPEELALLALLIPGGEALETFYLPPGFVVLRTRPACSA